MGLQGYQSLRRKVTNIRDDLDDNVNDAVSKATSQISAEAKRQVAMWDAVWKRNLYESIYSTDLTWTVDVKRHKVVARAPYAAFVEFGTGSRRDPSTPYSFRFDSPDEEDYGIVFSNIMWWVNTKPMFLGSRTPGTAAAITETIIEHGTYAQPFMRPAWHQNQFAPTGYAKAAMKRTVRRS